MGDFNKEFWEAISENEQVPFDELPARINEVLVKNPSWVQLPDTNTTVVYSGGFGGAGMTPAAQDFAARSAGTIGIIDNTKTGQALGEMVDDFYSSTSEFETKYSPYVDFDGHEITNSGPNSGQFKSQLFENFEPASSHFASHAKGNLITMTPEADVGRVYAQQEIPKIVDGMIEGRISHVNGRPIAEFNELLEPFRDPNFSPSFDSNNYSYQAIKDQFDGDFKSNIKNRSLDFHSNATQADSGGYNRDATRTVFDAEQADMKALGGANDVRLTPPNLEGLNAHDVHDFRSTATRISDADAAGELRSFAATPDGKTSYLIDTKTSTIYTVTGDDLTGVQKFDSSQEAGHAFGRMMSEAAQTYPDSFKGLPQVHNSLSSLGSHIDDLGRPAWRKALGAFGEGAAEFGGKASKILGPLGVAAAGAEVYGLESKLRDYEEFGLVPEEAMLAYRANLTAHTAQATVDPSLVGGEVVVQAAHDQWAKAYGISDEVKEALEPGSLLEDVYDATQWLEAQASAAGMAVKDYAVDRFHNPEKIGDDLERIGDAALNFGSDVLETTGQAVDAVGDYADARWNNPALFADDAQAVGGAIKDGVMGVWGSLFGKDEPSSLERTLENAGATPPFIPYSQGVEQFVNDRETLNAQDPQAQWTETRAANHPSAEAMLVRLHDAGIERLPSDIIAGETARERVSDVLTVTHDIDKSLNLQADNNRDQGQGQEQLQSEGTQNQNVTHAYTQEEYDYAYD